MEFKSICNWIESLPKPIGIFCCNDERSRDVVEACKICKLSIPEKVGILGVGNDVLICEMLRTPLSSIEHNSEVAGYEAAKLLYRMFNSNSTNIKENIIVEPTRIIPHNNTRIQV